VIASVLGVSAARAAAIAAEYPLQRIPRAGFFALSTIVSDANFACPALQVDRWTAKRVPTFAYEFDDEHRTADIRRARLPAGRNALIRDPVPLRSAERAARHTAECRSGGARRQHAQGLDQLRRDSESVGGGQCRGRRST
jgi:hypothetical protein